MPSFEEIINQFRSNNDQPTEKTASVNSEAVLKQRLGDAIEKTAAPVVAPDATETLKKLGEEFAATEKTAELAHAAALGRAFADNAISQWQSYFASAKTASAVTAVQTAVKMASAQGYADAMASLNTLGVKEAEMEKSAEYRAGEAAALEDIANLPRLGYLKTAAEMEYAAGQAESLQEIHKLASVEFLRGAAETEILLNQMAQAR